MKQRDRVVEYCRGLRRKHASMMMRRLQKLLEVVQLVICSKVFLQRTRRKSVLLRRR